MGWQDSQADIKSHWDENGWVAVRGFLDGGEVAGLRKEIDRYIEEVVPTVPEYEVMYDVKGQPETLKRLGHMSKYDDYFSNLIHTGKFTALAELLLMETSFRSTASCSTSPPAWAWRRPPTRTPSTSRSRPTRL